MRLTRSRGDMVAVDAIECVLLRPGLEQALADFFSDLAAVGDEVFFHPHGGDMATLRALAEQPGLDIYLLFVESEEVRAYGLLRGWSEGYAVPSLGIAVHPRLRGSGLGRLMMEYLETMARYRGAPAVRLRVHKDNPEAIAIYEIRGYIMAPDSSDSRMLVGVKQLGKRE